jgi:hypothetical protein
MKTLIPLLLTLTATGAALAQTCPANVKRSAPDSRYELQNSGAEVWDKQTDLIWQRCSLGQSWDGSTCTGAATRHTWQQALEAAKAAGGGWALPNKRELSSLVERGCYNPAINNMAFPNTPSSWYWSSSSVAGYGGYAWYVHFYDGYDGYGHKYSGYYVRLVRARQ